MDNAIVLRTVTKTRPKRVRLQCPHGTRRGRCKKEGCVGKGICLHNRRRERCKACGGKSLCSHGRRRGHCEECGGNSMCAHGRRRRGCKACGGRGLCTHGRQKSRCQACGNKRSVCPHGRRRGQCKECGGRGLCPHGRQKSRCRECGGTGFCTHERRKRECSDCKAAAAAAAAAAFDALPPRQRATAIGNAAAEASHGCVGGPARRIFRVTRGYTPVQFRDPAPPHNGRGLPPSAQIPLKVGDLIFASGVDDLHPRGVPGKAPAWWTGRVLTPEKAVLEVGSEVWWVQDGVGSGYATVTKVHGGADRFDIEFMNPTYRVAPGKTNVKKEDLREIPPPVPTTGAPYYDPIPLCIPYHFRADCVELLR